MKTIAVIAACACTLFAGAALAETLAEKTGVNSVLGISPTTPDFVHEVAISDMFEIESSKLAAQKSDDPATKTFAEQMVTDHTKTSTELKAAVASDPKSPIPNTMDSSHQGMLDKLKGLSGADFTKQYHDDQVSAHKGAVALFERYAKGGDSETLKSWASSTLPTLQHHLEMAETLDK